MNIIKLIKKAFEFRKLWKKYQNNSIPFNEIENKEHELLEIIIK